MRKTAIGILILVSLAAAFSDLPAAEKPAKGVLFFDRGHYWIELTFSDSNGQTDTPDNPDPSDFTILDLSSYESIGFTPSKVKIDYDRNTVILSSGKLKGKKCYRVTYRINRSDHIVFDLICDPFYFNAAEGKCPCKSFFALHVAPAFSKSGNLYNLNRFSYGYELSENRETSEIDIQPRFKIKKWELCPSLNWDKVTYHPADDPHLSGRRTFDIKLSRSAWVKELRYSLLIYYTRKRITSEKKSAEIPSFSQSFSAEGTVRLDYFFDDYNKFCYSVFKGVDLSFGYSWHETGGEPNSGSITPFLKTRFTWTLLYALQFSYSLESSFPSFENNNFEEFHKIRIRLLLRELLPAQERKSYHPDLELVFDTGKRSPLFIQEKKASLGFTFDLFPW